MAEQLARIIDRVRTRSRWEVEPAPGDGLFQIRSTHHGVIADGLTRPEAEEIAATFNEVRDDAAALAASI